MGSATHTFATPTLATVTSAPPLFCHLFSATSFSPPPALPPPPPLFCHLFSATSFLPPPALHLCHPFDFCHRHLCTTSFLSPLFCHLFFATSFLPLSSAPPLFLSPLFC